MDDIWWTRLQLPSLFDQVVDLITQCTERLDRIEAKLSKDTASQGM